MYKKFFYKRFHFAKTTQGKLILILIGTLLGVVLCGVYLNRPRHGGVVRVERAQVTRVIDGDTLAVLRQGYGTVKVRLIGIDAPEVGWVDGRSSIVKKEECFAQESKERLKELVENREVRLEKDVSEKDKYDRLLRYVYVGEENINEMLVREGFARLATYPPDTKYYGKLKEAERVAKENKTGLWSACILQ